VVREVEAKVARLLRDPDAGGFAWIGASGLIASADTQRLLSQPGGRGEGTRCA
jgi:hypothetical protein